MISRLLPTMKLHVKFMELQKTLLAGQTDQQLVEPHGEIEGSEATSTLLVVHQLSSDET